MQQNHDNLKTESVKFLFTQISFSAHKGKCLINIIAWPNALISEVDFFSTCGFDSPTVNYKLNIFQASHFRFSKLISQWCCSSLTNFSKSTENVSRRL